MTFERANTAVSQNQQRMARAVEELSSGMRVRAPWDRPAAAAAGASLKADAARLGAWKDTADAADHELQAADAALDGMANIMTQARELAVQMANGTYNAQDRAAAAQTARALSASMLALANTRHGDRYLFGGRADGAPPFDAAGTYAGDPGVRTVEVGPGLLADASIRGDLALARPGGTNVFAALDQLATDLAANNVAGVQGALSALESGTVQLAEARTEAGTAMAALVTASAAASTQLVHTQTRTASLLEADVTDSASRLALAQRAVEASLAATQRTFSLSLLERLR